MPGAPLHFGRAIGRWKVFHAPDAPILVAYGTMALAEAQERAAAAAQAGHPLLVIALIPLHAPQGWQVGVGESPETFRWVSTHHLLKDAEAQARQIIAGTRQAQRQRRQP